MSLRVAARRLTTLVTATVVAASVTATVATGTAFASNASMEAQFVAKMNAAREAAGLRPYAVASDLTSVARAHSAQMAQRQSLYHNPNLTTDVSNWQAVGENVGEGPSVQSIHDAFMHSPEHRANILDHDFTQVGVGVTVDRNGTIWVTEDFRQPMHASSSAPRPAARPTHRTTTSRPAGVSRPQPVAPRHTAATRHAHPVVARPATPHPAASPQAQLLARLSAARSAVSTSPSADPVTDALAYLRAVTTVTSGG